MDIDKLKAAYLSVEGMGCENCATRVRNSFLLLDGVMIAHIDLEEGIAYVAYDPEKVTPHQLLRAVNGAGNAKHRYWPNLLSLSTAREVFPWLVRSATETMEHGHHLSAQL